MKKWKSLILSSAVLAGVVFGNAFPAFADERPVIERFGNWATDYTIDGGVLSMIRAWTAGGNNFLVLGWASWGGENPTLQLQIPGDTLRIARDYVDRDGYELEVVFNIGQRSFEVSNWSFSSDQYMDSPGSYMIQNELVPALIHGTQATIVIRVKSSEDVVERRLASFTVSLTGSAHAIRRANELAN